MIKKVFLLLFVALCLGVCAVPSVGMLFAPSDEPVGNEKKTELPSLTDSKGSINTNYPSELGGYFEKHFAFRPLMIGADARIQSGLFGVSNTESVTVGSDDWLYYTSTLDDYQGKNQLSDRELNGAAHNLRLIQDYVRSKGADFLFTCAPNKNTLYPQHMPYYITKASNRHNRDRLAAVLSSYGVNYADLFEAFRKQDETLYFERDSHWNNKGALLAYNTLLDALDKPHDDYSAAQVTRKKDFVGDLSKMLYPDGSEPEYDSDYGTQSRFDYVTPTKSVEESFIKTGSADGSGSFLMYRDSFGNSLLPFMASAYKNAAFTKAFPILLESNLLSTKADTFVIELVERNLNWLVTSPPLMPSPEVTAVKAKSIEKDSTVTARQNEFMPAYLELTCEVERSLLTEDSVIYLSVTDPQGGTKTYECFTLADKNGRGVFSAYINTAAPVAPGSEWTAAVTVKNGKTLTALKPVKVLVEE